MATATATPVPAATKGEKEVFTVDPAQVAASEELKPLFAKSAEKDQAARAEAAAALAKAAVAGGYQSAVTAALLAYLKTAVSDKDANGAAGAFETVQCLALAKDKTIEKELLPFVGAALDGLGHKQKFVAASAQKALDSLVQSISPDAVKLYMPVVLENCMAYKWQTKQGALALISTMSKFAPLQVANCLPELVPRVTEALADTKASVRDAGIAAIEAACSVMGNRDVEPFVPVLVSCMANPAEVPECIHKLAATTFVQSVTSPTLSILVPLLLRALKEGVTAVKRKSMVIIENMSKLVEDPVDAHVFLPQLLPWLKRCEEEVSDPECRQVAERVHNFLVKVGAQESTVAAPLSVEQHVASLKATLATDNTYAADYLAVIVHSLIALKEFEPAQWAERFEPYLAAFGFAGKGEAIREASVKAATAKVVVDDDAEAQDLCNCEFSLAYGSKILLNNATLWLKKGRRYGLVGGNGCGKSTLMRAIANGQVDGFPPADELRTVYVETDIPADLAELSTTEFLLADPMLKDHKLEDLVAMLTSVGFSESMIAAKVSTFSGGWRMKVALARAMLKKAEILLLDEPTNHLDVKNVAWVENYLCSLSDVTSIIVSHDSGCLNRVCTDIIHMDMLKLKKYRGNLHEFVKAVPEAKAYFELKSEKMKFVFPEPGFLEGVKSKSRAILKMHNCGFTYPGTTRKILHGVSIQVSMASRCAVVGPNGAGKSTMIKLLTGELVPDEGETWKHPNLVMAYVAQHAFHHIESHLEKTPNEYIRWRYAYGEDKESIAKANLVLTPEEEEKMGQLWLIDGEKVRVERLLGRTQAKKGYKYEVKWVGKANEHNSWLPREKLEEMGWAKTLQRMDDKIAAGTTGFARPLSHAAVEKQLADLGLEAEFASHCRMDALSTSQKVKVVLAAALWGNPHIIVLDEPTNYLDRDSLGALADAIRVFGGGVIMISHNNEFTSNLCPETWAMDAGKLTPYGSSVEEGAEEEKLVQEKKEEFMDSHGNIVKIKQEKKKMSRKELKEYQRRRAAKKRNGEDVSDTDEDM